MDSIENIETANDLRKAIDIIRNVFDTMVEIIKYITERVREILEPIGYYICMFYYKRHRLPRKEKKRRKKNGTYDLSVVPFVKKC